MFEKIDSDKSGTIDRLELFTVMKELTDGKITENDVDQMMKGTYFGLNLFRNHHSELIMSPPFVTDLFQQMPIWMEMVELTLRR